MTATPNQSEFDRGSPFSLTIDNALDNKDGGNQRVS